jgi:hypothetical protein
VKGRMSHTIHVEATVAADHTVKFELPADVPTGPVRMTVTVEPNGAPDKPSPKEFLQSEFFGMWADRDDLPATNEEFTEWRRKLWDRSSQ